MINKLFIYLNEENIAVRADVLPTNLPEDTIINLYQINKQPWSGTWENYENGELPERTPKKIVLRLVNSEPPSYRLDLQNLINNHLSICMTGLSVDIIDIQEEVEKGYDYSFELEWITDETDSRITDNYLGLYTEGKIYVIKPNRICTPTILIHELFHGLELDHRLGGDKNIMGDDFLTTNYMLSPEQVTAIHGQDTEATLNETILPASPCIII